ncbi:MAG: molybdopterin-dependent oxidoreductase [Gaiellaceae bacterium]
MEIRLTLNGEPRTVECTPGESLLRVLRRLGCHSVRFGSASGETGAAAVLVDGRLVSSDVLLAAQVDGHEVMTLEGLDPGAGKLHPLQTAFLDAGAIQSGYSAGAMVLAAKALLERNPDPSEAEIRDAFSGILDRETGYVKVVEAVQRAAAALRGDDRPPVEPVVVRSPDAPRHNVVGRGARKVDAVRLAKGHSSFTDDFEPPGLLHAKVLRSPHAHARIVAIDDSAARALPGVQAVIHHANTPRVHYSTAGQSWPNPYPWDQVSFDDKVRHVGDRVAAVAAETPELAEEACRLIEVTYEVLPAVFDPAEALLDGAPMIHDEPDAIGITDPLHNIAAHVEGQTAEVDVALEQAEHVFDQTFELQRVQHCAIEPHVTVGWLDEDDRLVLRTSTQVPFHVRRMVAPLLGLPIKRIRVIKPRVGGGFGGKQEMVIEDIVGHLVLATGRPVRLELTREEEFASTRVRHPQTIAFRTGVDAEGNLLAQDMRVVADAGPFGNHGFTVQSTTGLRGLSSYNCPAKRYRCDVVYTNSPVSGAMRGYGAPQALFALESHMDDIARALRLDPIEFRRRNWVRLGDRLDIAPRLGERGGVEEVVWEDLPPVTSCGTEECVTQALRAIGWERRGDPSWRQPPDRPEVRRGIGFALCMQGSGIPFVDMGSASLKMNDDGSFNLLVGAVDIGTGADTAQAQIAAEVLGVQTEDVLVYSADTDLTPFDVGAYASGTTYISGMAVKKAAEEVRDQIALRAARMLGLDDGTPIELRDCSAFAPDGRSVTLAAVALNALHTTEQEQIMAVASHLAVKSPSPFAAQAAAVEVDVETGQITVTKLVTAVDCGVAINPVTASGQVEGAMVMALGYALTEKVELDEDGHLLNGRLGPYWIYRADDTPPTEVYLVETVEPSGPFGAKAVGEVPTDGVAPAVRNAILDATGVAINELPLTPERVWRALRQHAVEPYAAATAATVL